MQMHATAGHKVKVTSEFKTAVPAVIDKMHNMRPHGMQAVSHVRIYQRFDAWLCAFAATIMF